jgi:hypothetical protein
MKTKKKEKLILNRETLRPLTNLEQPKLQDVQGGGVTQSCEMISTCCNH